MSPQSETETARPALTPVAILAGFAVLLGFQLAGEILVVATRLISFAFPGPVAGMLLLLVFLTVRKSLDSSTNAVASGLIGVLSLLFVPSAVGVIQYGGVLVDWGGPLLLAVVLSTLATLLVTVGTFLWIAKLTGKQSP
jgi:holin-like protein